MAAAQSLQAIVEGGAPGQFNVLFTWTVPIAEQSQVIQFVSSTSGNVLSTPVADGASYKATDTNAPIGKTLIYSVCLQDITQPNNASVCSQTSVYIPIACSFSLSCPIHQNNPPTWTLSCGKPTDFYSDASPPINISTPNPSGLMPISKGANSASGVTTTEQQFVAACLPGTINQCSSNSTQVSQSQFCKPVTPPPPPPPPPPPSCKVCIENGGQCVTVNGKRVCRYL